MSYKLLLHLHFVWISCILCGDLQVKKEALAKKKKKHILNPKGVTLEQTLSLVALKDISTFAKK